MQMHSDTNSTIDAFIPLDHRQSQAALFAEKNGIATAQDVRPEYHWYHTADGTESDAAGYISDSVAGHVLNPLVSNKYAFTAPQDRWDYADQLLEDSVLNTTGKLVSYDWKDNGASSFRQVVLPAHSKSIRDGGDEIAFRIAEWDSCVGGAYQLKAGFYEWLCANTCTRGEDVLSIRAIHRGRPRKSITAEDREDMAYQEQKRYGKLLDATKNALGIYETTVQTLQELATLPVMAGADTLNFFRALLGKSKQNRALADHLHAKTEEHFAIKDSSWFDVHEVLTDYAARGTGTETLDNICDRSRQDRETLAARATDFMLAFNQSPMAASEAMAA